MPSAFRTADINATLSAAWGGSFVNNFIDRDRVKRVYMQGDAPYRMAPEDLNRWYVRSATGSMAPFSSFARANWTLGPSSLTRYNGSAGDRNSGQRRARRQFGHGAGGNGQAVQASCPRASAMN